jgi:predicted kinase
VASTDQPVTSDGTELREARLPEHSGDREVLLQKLQHLPEGHPSSPTDDNGADDTLPSAEPTDRRDGNADSPKSENRADTIAEPSESADSRDGNPESPGSAGGDRDSHGPRSDSTEMELVPPGADPAQDGDRWKLPESEHADRAETIREDLSEARREGLGTDKRYQDDDGIWTPERQDAHEAIVNDLYNAASNVPSERRAIMAGGLGGAGKSTVLGGYAGIDQSRYLKINPDDIKEEMAGRGLIPEIDGLSPMEASDLVHEESSAVAKMLARRAMGEGKNIIWDITMSSQDSALSRLDALDKKEYSTKGIFVDITIDEAVSRADSRHRIGHEDYLAGKGYGGRYVPPEVIMAQADPELGSINRRVFERVKALFTEWAVYDNNGAKPRLVQASPGWSSEEKR